MFRGTYLWILILSYSVRIMQYHGAIIAHLPWGSLACEMCANIRSWHWQIAPIQDQEILLSGAKSSTNYLYHAKCTFLYKFTPLFLIFTPLSACKNTTFTRFVLLSLAYQCPHMSDPPPPPPNPSGHKGYIVTSKRRLFYV